MKALRFSALFLLCAVLPSNAVAQTTFYTFQSGLFGAPFVWTTDPSGTLLINSAIPAPNDNIVILNGRTITMTTTNEVFNEVTVEDGGTWNLANTTGHSINVLMGQGVIQLDTPTLPTVVNPTDFLQNGTLEFSGTGNFDIPNVGATINNLTISGSGNKTLSQNLTLNGDLRVNSGTFTIGNNTTSRTLTLNGDFFVESGGNVRVNAANVVHRVLLFGDLINNGGSLVFHNSALDASPLPQNADYTSNPTVGAAELEMQGTTNNQILANGLTALNRLIINKGIDATFEVVVSSNDPNNFLLFGRNNQAIPDNADPNAGKAIWLRRGTLRLRSQVNIESLTEGGRDFIIPEPTRFWVDGATVFITTTANGSANQGLKPFGNFRISNGRVDTRNSAGISFRESAILFVEGGTLRASQIRRSGAASGSNFTSYIQIGGIVEVDGMGANSNAVGRFAIDTPESVFRMEGGILRLTRNNGAAVGGLQIDSDPSNIQVTGGTVEITPNGGDFEIGSNAPVFNLVINSGANEVDLRRPLDILNDFSIGDGVDFRTNNNDVSVGGDWTIVGTYSQGTNTTTLNGNGDATLTVDRSTSVDPNAQWFFNLTINKQGGQEDTLRMVKIAGNNSVVRVTNFLEHVSGVVDINSFGFRFVGDARLGSQIGIPGTTGFVNFNGTNNQTLEIVNNPIGIPGFNRLNQGKTGGGISLTGLGTTLTVFENLTLAGNGGSFLANDKEVRVLGNIVAGGGTFTSAHMIQFNGNNSDGGLTFNVTSNGTFIFPVGVGSIYTPAVATISGFSDDGLLTINPVNSELATLSTDPGDALQYYWRVRQSDFTAAPQAVYTFTYDQSFVQGAEANYVAGRVAGAQRISDGDDVDEATNVITFDGLGSGGTVPVEDASYTAAEAARFGGTVRIFYSRFVGPNSGTFNLNNIPDWANPNSWTFDPSHVGLPAGDTPGPNDIVVIGQGGTHNTSGGGNRHHIMIENIGPGADALAAEVRIPRGTSAFPPILFIRQNAEANFGALKGGGDVRALVTQTNSPIFTADIGEFANTETALWQYFAVGGTNITLPSFPNLFPNLRIEGNGNRNFTFPTDIITRRNFIIDGRARFSPSANVQVEGQLNLGGFNEGVWLWPATGAPITLQVRNKMLVRNNNASSMEIENVAPTPANLTHRMILLGDIEVAQGRMDLYDANRALVELEVAGTTDATFTNATASQIDLNNIIVNKTQASNSFRIDTDFTLNAPSNGAIKPIVLQRGRLILNNNGIDVTVNSGGADFQIPVNTALEIQAGTVRVNGDDTGLLLTGELALNGANAQVILGDGVGNDNNYIEYSGSGTSTIRVVDGMLSVGSQIRRGFLTDGSALTYIQTGGIVEVGRRVVPNNSRSTFEILNPGSSFTHSAGDLFIVREQPSAGVPGFRFNPFTVSATAPINIGNASTPNNETITIDAAKPIGTLVVNANAPNLTARLQVNDLRINTNLDIQTGTTFETQGLGLFIGGNLTNNGVFTGTGSTVTFDGAGAQTATTNASTTFTNLTVNKPNGTVTFGGSTNPLVQNDLSLLSGTLNDGGLTISVQGDLFVNSAHSSTGAGRLLLNGASSQTITTDNTGALGSVELNNPSGFILINDLGINGALTFTNGILNIDDFLLSLGLGTTIAGTPSATSMIRPNGSASAAGVSKIIPTGASTFDFPFGVGNRFTPARYQFTSNNTQGTLQIRPVDLAPNTATDGGDDILSYHWEVAQSGFTTFNVNKRFIYAQSDVQLTGANTEADYIPGRFGSVWTQGLATEVDEVNNEIFFNNVDFLEGTISAGIAAELGTLPVFYSRTGKTGILTQPGADWNELDTWSTVPWTDPDHNNSANFASSSPNGNEVQIRAGHFVQITIPSQITGRMVLNGTLDINNTVSHQFGIVSGTGTIEVAFDNNNVPFPVGDFSAFNSSGGGTVVYNSNNDLTLPSNVNQYNNLIIESTGQFSRILPSLDITVFNDLTIRGAARFNPNNRTIRVRGRFINESSNPTPFVSGNSRIIFDGSAAQSIEGTNTTTFFNVQFQNGSTTNTINQNITINGTLTVSNGELDLNGKVITLSPTASLAESSGQRIKGNNGFITTIRNLSSSPGNVGNMGFDIFFTEQAPGLTEIRRYHSQITEDGLSSINRWFRVSPNNNTGLNASVRFRYDDEEMAGNDETSLILYRKPTAGSWVARGGTVNTGSNFITLTGINAFSDWTADLAGSLPISLSFFDVRPVEVNMPQIIWETQTEFENFGFFLDRAQVSGSNAEGEVVDTLWQEIAFVEGEGTSFEPIQYAYLDESLTGSGTFLYRLRQVDFDGTTETFGPIKFNVAPPSEFKLLNSYPNPFNPTTTIPFEVAKSGRVQIRIYDILGRVIQTLVDGNRNAGRYQVIFDARNYASGIYIIRFVADGRSFTKKITLIK